MDAIAHQGATTVGGQAIGVIGTGIDVCYPKENKKLYEKVLERGAILSEFPMGSHPAPENFPVRNRIIAGMPLGVVIVEGKQYSGSLITARLAMEFGREVFAVPGNATQEMSFAPNQLIKQGAKLVTNAEDVIEELPTPVRAALVQAEVVGSEQRNFLAESSLTDSQKRLYDLLTVEEPRGIDDIVETSGLNSSEVLATLFDLEMKGMLRQLPGKHPPMIPAREALERLREGNRRFASGLQSPGAEPVHSRRDELTKGQEPFAIILGCSDSRVPAEIVFDQGLGDLFVIRVAGNIVAPSQVGSVEFAAARFGTRLVVVLGHSQCGAILATLEELQQPTENQSRNLRSIVDRVRPSVEALLATELRHDPTRWSRAGRARQHPRLGEPPAARLGDPRAADPRRGAAASSAPSTRSRPAWSTSSTARSHARSGRRSWRSGAPSGVSCSRRPESRQWSRVGVAARRGRAMGRAPNP